MICGPLGSSYLFLLSHSPYLKRYLWSTHTRAKPGQQLAPYLANVILRVANQFDLELQSKRFDSQGVGNVLSGLALLCEIVLSCTSHRQAVARPVKISKDTAVELLAYLRRWSKAYSGEQETGLQRARIRICLSLGVILANLDVDMVQTQQSTRQARKHLSTCALPGCSVSHGLSLCNK